jgi:23S rRNA (uracil1939-C5)-methyltransferase
MKKNDLIKVKTEKMVYQGFCLARIEGKVVFIEGCLPGEVVTAKIKKIKSDYIEAIAEEILEPSNFRIEPICKFFGLCGGCKLQNITYDEQLKIKKSFVEEAFTRISKIQNLKINDVIGSDEQYYYRNKMEFSFAKRWLFNNVNYSEEEKNFALGLHIPKQFDKVIHIDQCFLSSDFLNQVRNFVGEFLFKRNVSIHSLKNKFGLLKALIIRESRNTKEKLVALVTTKFEDNLIYDLSKQLELNFPEITTFVNIISSPEISSTLPEKIITIYGKGFIVEKLLGHDFEIYPNTFFQTNTRQAEKLFSTIIKYLEKESLTMERHKNVLIDLYSGVGVIGILLSKYFEKVIAFEEVKESVESAHRNAEINFVKNIEFIQKDLNNGFNIIEELKNKEITLIIDPPRSGLSNKTIDSILRLKPKRIIYVSCNPLTQARDLINFKKLYHFELIQPVDMFPQTYHVENIAILKISY